jgi:hypothetical protein
VVRVRRLTTRVAPDGTWSEGDEAEVTPHEAARLIASGHAVLVSGQTLETASLTIGATPERGLPRATPKDRGG